MTQKEDIFQCIRLYSLELCYYEGIYFILSSRPPEYEGFKNNPLSKINNIIIIQIQLLISLDNQFAPTLNVWRPQIGKIVEKVTRKKVYFTSLLFI